MKSFSAPAFVEDPLFWCAALAIVALTPALTLWPGVTVAPHVPAWRVWVFLILAYPVLEEVIFRAGLQSWLLSRWPARWWWLSLANGVTALVFALAHLFTHPPGWAMATIVPALLFGLFYERHAQRLAGPVLLHVLANAAYFCLLAVPG